MICSAIVYYILYKAALMVYGIQAATSYNSLSNLENISLETLTSAAIGCYKSFAGFFWGKDCAVGAVIARSCNIIFAVLALLVLLFHFYTHKQYWYNKMFIILAIIAFPGIACMMDIMMLKEKLDFYILYPLFLYYVLLLLIIKECDMDLKKIYCSGIVKRILIVCFVLVMFQNVLFSNETYVYQKVLYDRAVSIAGRILDSIEECPEYEAGTTEIVLVGTIQNNDELKVLNKSSSLRGGKVLSITYNQTFGSFVSLLGSKFNQVSDNEMISYYTNCKEVIDMPEYPDNGYWKMLDGKMVIKLSE